MIKSATAIILSGGKSSRFGTNKALAPWQGGTLIEFLIVRLKAVFPKVLIVAKATGEYAFLRSSGVEIIQDQIEDVHPLSGFEAGLRASETWANFFTACDMPFPNADLMQVLWKNYQGQKSALGRWQGKPQPFFGFYSKKCLPQINVGLKRGSSLEELIKNINAYVLPEEQVRRADPHGFSFLDLDTKEEYDQVRGLALRVEEEMVEARQSGNHKKAREMNNEIILSR